MRKEEQMKQMKRRWRVGLSLALALAIAMLVLAGCGGSSGSSSGGSSTESSTAASSAGSETATGEGTAGEGKGGLFNISEEAKACLKEKGVELPEFKGGEGGSPGGAEGEMPAPGEKPEGGEMPEGAPEGAPEGGEGGPPGFGGAGSEEMKKAFEECGVETPQFKGGPGGEGGKPNVDSAAFKKQVREYVACVRENGFELAEPDFSGEGPIFEKAESESAAFKKASAQCQGLLGGPQTPESQAG
jgi:hypothetical protein